MLAHATILRASISLWASILLSTIFGTLCLPGAVEAGCSTRVIRLMVLLLWLVVLLILLLGLLVITALLGLLIVSPLLSLLRLCWQAGEYGCRSACVFVLVLPVIR